MSVEEQVKKIIMEQLGVTAEEVKPEASFVEDLGADSLDLTELIMAMEEAFDVEIGGPRGRCSFRSCCARVFYRASCDQIIRRSTTFCFMREL